MSPYAVFLMPVLAFIVFVAPLWIVMHYRSISRSSRSLGDEDRELLEAMLADQHRLVERIGTLESLLEDSDPNWRRDRVA